MFGSFNALQNQHIANPTNWVLWLTALGIIIAIFVLIYTIKHYRLNKKATKKQNEELRIEITEISARPWVRNGCGGWSSSCYIKIDVHNPNPENNEVEFAILHPKSDIIYAKLKNRILPALVTTSFKIEFNPKEFDSEKKINAIREKELLLAVKDIHKKEFKQFFIFENVP